MRSPLASLIFCVALLPCLAPFSFAVTHAPRQDDATIAPPPPRVFSNEEKAQLAAISNDRRKRVRLSLELAANRLTRAEQLTREQQYAPASIELGGYEAIIEDALEFMQEQSRARGASRDLLKRFEQTLRAHAPRLEGVRRTTPPSYAVHVGTTLKLAQRARTKALNAFFGDGTIHDLTTENPSSSNQESRATNPDATPPRER